MLKNYLKHFITVTKHRYYVFQECFRGGLIWQGLVHDLSKYSPTEFRVGRYYRGTGSPIDGEKKALGYSKTWLHHIHKNPHHWEYWYDPDSQVLANIPEKFRKEWACDIIGASRAYNGKNFTPEMPIEFAKKKYPKMALDMVMPHLIEHLRKYYGLQQ